MTQPTRCTSPPLGILREASQPPPHQSYKEKRYRSWLRCHSSRRMTPRPSALLLLVLALPLTQNCAGSHWLQFFHTVVYGPDIWEPRYIYVSYVDTTQVLGFDSTAATGVQPRAPWIEQEPPEYWRNQTEEALYLSQGNRKLFRDMMKYYGHSKDSGESSQIRGHNPSHVQLVPLQISRSRVKSRIVIREQG